MSAQISNKTAGLDNVRTDLKWPTDPLKFGRVGMRLELDYLCFVSVEL